MRSLPPLLFIVTIVGILVLLHSRPDAEKPYRAFGVSGASLLYISGSSGNYGVLIAV